MPYYVLIAVENWLHVLIFGDYDLEAVEFERDDLLDSALPYDRYEIVELPDDRQETIDALMEARNRGNAS